LAHQAGVPKRIAHSHNDTAALDRKASLVRKVYLRLMRGLIERYATLGLAASSKAAASLFGPAWQQDTRWQVHYCSIDMHPFQQQAANLTPEVLRATLNLPATAFVVGHVGRFVAQKNHRFLLEIAAAVHKQDAEVYFLLVGDGPLRPAIEVQAATLGIADQLRFTGVRSDIPALMCHAMDLFLLPSLHEGLCIVGMEAQAAGLPLVLADTVTPEVAVVDDLVSFQSLADAPSVWADRILAYKRHTRYPDRAHALAQMKRSPFNIEMSLDALEQIYSN
jgi:glycosyltransferase involved in cell wall biosynthesis